MSDLVEKLVQQLMEEQRTKDRKLAKVKLMAEKMMKVISEDLPPLKPKGPKKKEQKAQQQS